MYHQVMRQLPAQHNLWLGAMQSEFDSLTFAPCYAHPPDRATDSQRRQVIQWHDTRQGYAQRGNKSLARTTTRSSSRQSVRLIALLVCANDIVIEQVDVKTVYLNADLNEEIFCVLQAVFTAIVDPAGHVSLLPSTTQIPSTPYCSSPAGCQGDLWPQAGWSDVAPNTYLISIHPTLAVLPSLTSLNLPIRLTTPHSLQPLNNGYLTGMLQHAARSTRTDISCSMSQLARRQDCPPHRRLQGCCPCPLLLEGCTRHMPYLFLSQTSFQHPSRL
jgi:hypothetical protein